MLLEKCLCRVLRTIHTRLGKENTKGNLDTKKSTGKGAEI
jgi:hypothetical protein